MNLKQKPSGYWMVDFTDDQGERRRVSTGIKTVRSKKPPAEFAAEINAKAREIAYGVGKTATTAAQSSAQKAGKQAGQLIMRELFDKCVGTVWHPSEVKSQATILSNAKILTGLGVTARDIERGRHPDGIEVTTRDAQGRVARVWRFGTEPAADITFSALEDLTAALKAQDYAPGTIKRKLDMVSKALRMASKWTDPRTGRSFIKEKPAMPSFRIDNLKDRVLHGARDAKLLGCHNEEAAVFAAIEKRRIAEPGRHWARFGALLRVLIEVGGRLGETLNVGPNAQDIGYRPIMLEDGSVIQRPVVTFPRYGTKSDKPRTVPLSDAAWQALQGQRGNAGLRSVKKSGGVVEDKVVFFPMREALAWYMFDQIKADLLAGGIDIKDVTLHTMRHTCLTRLAQGGMDLFRLQKWAGHSDPKITAERYGHLIPSDLMGGLLILGSSNGTLPPIRQEDGNRPEIMPDMISGVNRASAAQMRLQ